MSILARYTPKNCIVEVVNVFDLGQDRKRFLVRAIEGEPFDAMSHGGPMTTDSALVSGDLLSEVHQEPEPQPRRRSVLAGDPRPEPVYTDLEDMTWCAALFVTGRRSDHINQSRGGMSQD
jgi:hypothetical protein